MLFRQLVDEPPPEVAIATLEIAPAPLPAETSDSLEAFEAAVTKILDIAEPEPVAEEASFGEPVAVRHGAEGLGGSGEFSCALEAGVRRCRSDG